MPWHRTGRCGRRRGGVSPFLAGAGAGAVAGLAGVGAEMLLRAAAPTHPATLGSAFIAGILGGILYAVLGRVTRRPAAALWVITLAVATIDSLLIATEPLASGPNPSTGIPIVGLVVPARQLLALAGMGHLSTRHFPERYIVADAATHYITAVAVSLLVPWWAGPRRR
ncbi:MAG TPA: hypothetical protein VKW09_11250 [bacterium]|nr:hypothetical protein [bacterium]